jgi:hypothetical protein
MNEIYEEVTIQKTIMWLGTVSLAPIAFWLFILGVGGLFTAIYHFLQQ